MRGLFFVRFVRRNPGKYTDEPNDLALNLGHEQFAQHSGTSVHEEPKVIIDHCRAVGQRRFKPSLILLKLDHALPKLFLVANGIVLSNHLVS